MPRRFAFSVLQSAPVKTSIRCRFAYGAVAACWFAGIGLVQAATASKAEPRMEVLANLAYAGTEHPRQTLDLYLPKERKGPARLPVVVHIHGGG